jgi:hypothetical protein
MSLNASMSDTLPQKRRNVCACVASHEVSQ